MNTNFPEPIRQARCSCGQLTATTRGEPVRVAAKLREHWEHHD